MALSEAAMRQVHDSWYVRLPDGRVVRAKTTDSVRHHLERGRLPLDCWVRRSPDQEWQTLEWTSEFVDLVRRRVDRAFDAAGSPGDSGNGAPRSSHELRAVGVHGLVEELFNAFDTTLTRSKLLLAAVVGLLSAAALLVMPLLPQSADFPLSILPPVLAGVVLLVLLGVGAAILTQITFVERSRLRAARRGEIWHRLGRNASRIVVAFFLLGGLVLLAVAGLREWPAWLLEQRAEGAELLAGAGTVLAVVLEVVLWPVLGLILLLVPIVVIEECGLTRAIAQWVRLLQQHLARIVLYEALTFALGVIAVLPFVLPVVAAGAFAPADDLASVRWTTLFVLGGLSLSPLFAYLVVANVYIYLNLRYETAPSDK